ncbi:uncharacterized protein LOC135220798 isoform X1 [Macrobrachium nipponense]|uniref:uncharacterized protein LOC135220798 isoform X1 n=1 Tax=Macrobrachium nipponense TaxID=159736 RepID=UPI0030C80B1D
MEGDTGNNSNDEVDFKNLIVEEKCSIVLEECDTDLIQDNTNDNSVDGDTNKITMTREEKFRLTNKKCERLIKYLSTGSHVRGLTQNQKRIVRSQAKNHIWDKSKKLLYYTATKDGRRVLVVRDENQVDSIIKTAHLRSDGGHHGINVTAGIIAAKYYWNNMRIDVMDYISKCYHCQAKNRGSSKKMRVGDGVDLGDMENEEDEEFTHDATKALIEAIRNRYGQLSERHKRPVVYKEVQEELAQKGFYFNKERVRRKWNTLIAMHKRMRREFFEVNPTWEYYQMIDSFHGDTDYGMQDDNGTAHCSNEVNCLRSSEDKSTCTKLNNSNVENVSSLPSQPPASLQNSVYVPPEVTCSTAQVYNVTMNYGNTHPIGGEHTYTSNLHKGGPFVSLGSNSAVFKGKKEVSNVQGHVASQQGTSVLTKPIMLQSGNSKTVAHKDINSGIKTVPMVLKIVPDLSGVQGVNASQVQPITVVGALSGKNEVKQISNPKLILNKSPPAQIPNSKNSPTEIMSRQEKLKLKTLLSIEKELKNLSQIQRNILKTQEQILNAVTGNATCEKTLGINKSQENSLPLKQVRKR